MKVNVKNDALSALQAAHLRMVQAMKESDWEAMVTMYSDDAVFMPPNDTSVYGKAEVSDWHKEYFQHFKIKVLAASERDVTPVAGYAIERWCYEVVIKPIAGGDLIRDEGRFLTVWKRDGVGEWKIAQMIWNSIRPIGAGTSRFMALFKERQNAK